jgi:membrane fusion protein, multidrug efflux system
MKLFDRGSVVIEEEQEEEETKQPDRQDASVDIPVKAVPPPSDGSTEPESSRSTVAKQFLEKLHQHKIWVGGFAALLLVLSVGGRMYLKGKAAHAMPANPAVPVTVRTLTEKPVRLWSEFSGRMEAVNFAEIRPEVSGRITEVRFEDGQIVKKGQVLFVIDPGPYKAALTKAEANAVFAKTEFDRAGGLVQAQAIAQRLYDERLNASRAAEAELARARIDYDRAYVKAPISGRVSRPEITVGNVVQSGSNAPLLTSIVSKDGIYADFEVDEQTYLQSIRNHAGNRDQERAIPVELTIQGDKARVYNGTIYSFDNKLDTVSGTIRARAKFANEDGALMPGMFVSVKLGSSQEVSALLVPERAVSVDQNKKFVYVVDASHKVGYREVTLGKQLASERVVLTGLQSGDRVIVDGLQHVRPEAVVTPTEEVVRQPAAAPTATASL